MRFADRADGGRQLAAQLTTMELEDPVVLALPRGGVPVAAEVARALGAPLDVFVVRKIGAPFQPELGVGALAEGGEPVLDERALRRLSLAPEDLAPTISAERVELARRLRHYRGDGPGVEVEGRDVVLVDDGLATGSSARAALSALRARRPRTLILAVPVSAAETLQRLRDEADDVVCVTAPDRFYAVGQWYDDFSQTSDEEVVGLLNKMRSRV